VTSRGPTAKGGRGKRDKAAGYLLRLYVTGATARSVRAIQNIQRICEEHLRGRYTLEVVDLYKNIDQARADQILAAPTLVKRSPPPLRHLVGDLSDDAKVLAGLSLTPGLG